MQVDISAEDFNPFVMTIRVETLQEARALYNRMMIPSYDVARFAQTKPHVYQPHDNSVDMTVACRFLKALPRKK